MLRRRKKVIACCVVAMGAYLMLKKIQGGRKESKRIYRSVAAHTRDLLLNRKRDAANLENAEFSSDDVPPPPKLVRGKPSKQPTPKERGTENEEEHDVLAEVEVKIEDHHGEEQDPIANPQQEIKVENQMDDDLPLEEEVEAFEGDISESQNSEEHIHKVGGRSAVRKVLTTAGTKNRLKEATEDKKFAKTDPGDLLMTKTEVS